MIKVLLITALILIGIAVVADIVMVIRLCWLLHKGMRELGEEKRDQALLMAWTALEAKRRQNDNRTESVRHRPGRIRADEKRANRKQDAI